MNNLNLNVEFCCTCLKVCSEKDKFLSLSFATHRSVTYRNQLKFCVPEMGSEINMDSYICKPCSIALENAYNFRCMCLRTDRKLNSIRISQRNSLKDISSIREDLLALLNENKVDLLPRITPPLRNSNSTPFTFDEDKSKAEVSRELGSLLSQSLSSSNIVKIDYTNAFHIPEIEQKNEIVSNKNNRKLWARKKPLTDDEIIKLACKTNPQLRGTPIQSLNCRVSLEKIFIKKLPVIIPSPNVKGERKKRKTRKNKNQFYCTLCAKDLRQRDRYYSHVLKHSNIRAYKCSVCPLKYFSADSLRTHEKKHKKLINNDEQKVDPLKIKIKKENKAKVTNSKKKAEKCILKIKMGGKFNNSVAKSNTENVFSCSECVYHTPSKALYNQHTLQHLKTRKHICEICSKSFASLSSKNKHKRNLHKNVSAVTKVKRQKKKPVLPMNIKSEPTTEEPTPDYEIQPVSMITLSSKCDTCGECFDSEDSLEVHKKIHIEKIEMTDISNVSNGTSNISNGTSNVTNSTINISNGTSNVSNGTSNISNGTSSISNIPPVKPKKKKKKYFCPICNSEFSSRDHANIHTGDKPYTCNICAKTFGAYTTLRKHRNTHQKDIPEARGENKPSTLHKCEICKQEFVKASDAVSHTCKTSSGESVYRCQICKNAYLGRNALIDHMRMHLKENDESL